MDDFVQKIQTDILKPETKLGSVLLAAKVLAHRLNNPEFINWVKWEVDGYRRLDELPDYRKFVPPSKGTFRDNYSIVSNHMIPLALIPDNWLQEKVMRFPVFEGIRSVEELANHPKPEINVPWPNELVQLLNKQEMFNMYCVEAFFVLNPHQFAQILDTVRSRLLDFVLEIGDLNWDMEQAPPPNDRIQQLVEVKIYNTPQGGNMSIFDQRGQTVNYQYNAAGNINIEVVQNEAELIEELGKLKLEIEKAKTAGAVDEDVAIDAEYQVQKAIQAAKKPEPDKTSLMDHIGKAKELLEDATAATGLVTALLKAADIAKDLF